MESTDQRTQEAAGVFASKCRSHSNWFNKNFGIYYSRFSAFLISKQGDPTLSFITYREHTLEEINNNNSNTGISVQGIHIDKLKFSDDMNVMDQKYKHLRVNVLTAKREGGGVNGNEY